MQDVDPRPALYQPSGQCVHVGEEVELLKVPGKHCVQNGDPRAEEKPAGQGTQGELKPSDEYPEGQGKHTPAHSGAANPGGQEVQTLVGVTAKEKFVGKGGAQYGEC